MRTSIPIAVIFALYSVASNGVAQQPDVNQVLNWLPVDTETVLGANGPFAWVPSTASNHLPNLELLTTTELETQTRAVPLTLLNFKNGGLGDFVKGKTLALVIEGSRRFRPPTALGIMRYEGCLIMVFLPTVSLDGSAFMRTAADSAVRFEEHVKVREAGTAL